MNPVHSNTTCNSPYTTTLTNRCLFETFFTLDAELEIRQKVLQALVLVGRRAAPGQGLGSLGGALARRAAETGDEGAAYFLNLVPPTVS